MLATPLYSFSLNPYVFCNYLWYLIFLEMWSIVFSRFSCLSFIIRQNTQLNWRREKFVGVQYNMSFVHFHVRPVTVDILKPIRLSRLSSSRSYVSHPSLDLQDIRFLNRRLLQQSLIVSTYEITEFHDVCFDKWFILVSSNAIRSL